MQKILFAWLAFLLRRLIYVAYGCKLGYWSELFSAMDCYFCQLKLRYTLCDCRCTG